jgi:hypothetical protein
MRSSFTAEQAGSLVSSRSAANEMKGWARYTPRGLHFLMSKDRNSIPVLFRIPRGKIGQARKRGAEIVAIPEINNKTDQGLIKLSSFERSKSNRLAIGIWLGRGFLGLVEG